MSCVSLGSSEGSSTRKNAYLWGVKSSGLQVSNPEKVIKPSEWAHALLSRPPGSFRVLNISLSVQKVFDPIVHDTLLINWKKASQVQFVVWWREMQFPGGKAWEENTCLFCVLVCFCFKYPTNELRKSIPGTWKSVYTPGNSGNASSYQNGT